MRKAPKVWRSTICGILAAVSLSVPGDVKAQLTGSGKLTPVVWNNGKIYFFRGSQYTRYDVAQDQADTDDGNGNSYPRPIQDSWPGLFADSIDAAVFWPAPPPGGAEIKTVAYFFKGNQFMRYDVATDRADAADGAGRSYPQPISLKWPGIWTDRVDAILVWRYREMGGRLPIFSEAINTFGLTSKIIVLIPAIRSRLWATGRISSFQMESTALSPGLPKSKAGRSSISLKAISICDTTLMPIVPMIKVGGGFSYPASVAENWSGLLMEGSRLTLWQPMPSSANSTLVCS